MAVAVRLWAGHKNGDASQKKFYMRHTHTKREREGETELKLVSLYALELIA